MKYYFTLPIYTSKCTLNSRNSTICVHVHQMVLPMVRHKCSVLSLPLAYISYHGYKAAQAEARPGRSSDLRSCWTAASHFPPTLSITTPSPLSQTYLTDAPLHLTLTSRDTFFLTKSCCRIIFKPSFPLLLISFTLFTFPSASCWTFLL